MNITLRPAIMVKSMATTRLQTHTARRSLLTELRLAFRCAGN